jgi:DNA invertase Pin-like site-specific DNA recombinase
MADREGRELKQELGGAKGRQGTCFSPDLKARAARWIRERRAAGATAAQIAEELGVASGTVLRWSADARLKQARALVPVEIVPDRSGNREVSVVSPSGFRIEGLSLTEAITLLRALG